MALSNTAPLDFTDGDTLKRFTITDAQVSTTRPAPQLSIYRQNVAAVDDAGWVYVVNGMSIANGSFDVLVAALSGDGVAAANEFPNEIVTLAYQLT